MKPFLIDNDKVYTYQDLLDAIQTDGFYYPYYKVHDVFLYFVNLVKALANNQSLVLLDSDLNSSEIENLDESLVNQPRIINTSSFSDVPEVINAVKKSAAEITIFTSGTTGQPKKVLHSISSLTRSVEQVNGMPIKYGAMLTLLLTWRDCKYSSKHLKMKIH